MNFSLKTPKRGGAKSDHRKGPNQVDEIKAKPAKGSDNDMELRDAIQRIALEWPSYGRPRITEELRRRGWTVNPKRVCRLLREDNLLCVRKRKFVVTTDSNHGRKVYPNLAAEMVLTGVEQLWRADLKLFWAVANPEVAVRWITGGQFQC
jgi:transposase InsO family protein